MSKLRLHLGAALLFGMGGTLAVQGYLFLETERDKTQSILNHQLVSIRNRWEHDFAIIRQEALAMIDQRALPHLSALIAVRTFQRSETGEWIFTNRVRHAPGDSKRLEMTDFTKLDLAFPIPFKKLGDELEDFSRFARLPNDRPIIRYATRIDSTIYVVEVNHDPITRALGTGPNTYQFAVGSNGDLLAQSNPKHFVLGEDLKHMPITEIALRDKTPTATVTRYRELPNLPLQDATWCYSKLGNFTLIAQSPAITSLDFIKQRKTLLTLITWALLAAISLIWARIALRVYTKTS